MKLADIGLWGAGVSAFLLTGCDFSGSGITQKISAARTNPLEETTRPTPTPTPTPTLPSGPSARTLFGEQTFIVASNSAPGDTVGEIFTHYKIFQNANPVFEISTNTANSNFAVSGSGVVSLTTMNGLAAGQAYMLTVRAFDANQMIEDFKNIEVRVVSASDIIFIDPSYGGTENGSKSQPFNTWAEARSTMTTGSFLLQKRGTSASLPSFDFNRAGVQNITIGAYGSGAKPVMEFSSGGINLSGKTGIVVRDLSIISPSSAGTALSIPFNSQNATVDNCTISGGRAGIDMGGSLNMKVINNEIHHNREDGIYTTSDSGVHVSMQIGFNYIHHVNQNFVGTNVPDSVAPGDSMQLNGLIDTMNVHHNILDRSDTGNKFCFITSPRDHSSVISINYNYCKANNSVTALTNDPVSGIYIENILLAGGNSNDLTIIGNKFENVNIGILIRDFLAIHLHSNQFNGVTTGLSLGENTAGDIYHNLIRNASTVAVALTSPLGSFRFKNNIFAVAAGVPIYGSGIASILESDHNIFSHQAGNFVTGYSNFAAWQASGKDGHSVVGTPNFVNAPALDFHLQPASIGVGDGIGGLGASLDIESHPFPNPPHVGPHQYVEY